MRHHEHYDGELQDLVDGAEVAHERFPGELREVIGELLALRGAAEAQAAGDSLVRMVGGALASGDLERMRSALKMWRGLSEDARNRILKK